MRLANFNHGTDDKVDTYGSKTILSPKSTGGSSGNDFSRPGAPRSRLGYRNRASGIPRPPKPPPGPAPYSPQDNGYPEVESVQGNGSAVTKPLIDESKRKTAPPTPSPISSESTQDNISPKSQVKKRATVTTPSTPSPVTSESNQDTVVPKPPIEKGATSPITPKIKSPTDSQKATSVKSPSSATDSQKISSSPGKLAFISILIYKIPRKARDKTLGFPFHSTRSTSTKFWQ